MVRSAETSGVGRVMVSRCWVPCPFCPKLGIQGHGLPSTPLFLTHSLCRHQVEGRRQVSVPARQTL